MLAILRFRASKPGAEGFRPRPSRCVGPPSMTGRDLKLHERHSLQRCWVSLAFLGSAKNGFSYRLHMCGTNRVGQRRNRSVQGIFHNAYRFRWKRCVRKVFHLRSISIEFLRATSPEAPLSNSSVRPSRFGGNWFGFPASAALSLSPISVQIAPLWTRLI